MNRIIRGVGVGIMVWMIIAAQTTIVSAWSWQPLDLIVIVLTLASVERRPWFGLSALVVSATWHYLTSVGPWWVYGLADGAVMLMARLFIRRIVAERATPSLLLAATGASLSYSFVLLSGSAIVHWLDPVQLSYQAGAIYANGLAQMITTPLVTWSLWRWRSSGHFSSVSSLERPFA